MTYKKKYYGYFADMSAVQHTIELWEDTSDTLLDVEIDLMSSPFQISMPQLDHKFQPIRGTGCTINILSKTDRQFLTGLYFVGQKQFMVKHYIDESLNWCGYLNPEMYREPFSFSQNYPIQVTGNDGFALMDRIVFLQDDDTHYTGLKSLWELIGICLNKIALPWVDIRVMLSTEIDGITTGAYSTILHNQYVDCANFYDEDDMPFNIRRVLEGILQPFGAFITQVSGSLIITDIHTIATQPDFIFNTYELTGTDWLYSNQIIVPNSKTVQDIGYNGTGQEIEISGGINKQVVSYSPYPLVDIMSTVTLTNINEFDLSLLPETWTVKNGYYQKELSGHQLWDAQLFEVTKQRFDPIIEYANYATLVAATDENAKKENTSYHAIAEDTYWRWNGFTYIQYDGTKITWGSADYVHATINYIESAPGSRALWYIGGNSVVLPASTLVGTGLDATKTDGAAIMIKGKIGVIFHMNSTSTPGNSAVKYFYQKIKVQVGNMYYNGADWTTTPSYYNARISLNDDTLFGTHDEMIVHFGQGVIKNNIGDKGNDGIFIPITTDLSGLLVVEFWPWIEDWEIDFTLQTGQKSDNGFIKERWISDLSIVIVREDASEISNNDVEYIGKLNKAQSQEGEKIELICGTNAKTTDRGKLLSYSGGTYSIIKNWTRQGQTNKIELLLLNSLCSNYKTGFAKLNNMILNNTFNQANLIIDTYEPDRLFIAKQLDIDYQNSSASCTLEEIFADHLNINEDL